MRPRRRRAPDPQNASALRAFSSAATHVDAAQRALLAAVPTARHPGVPLAQAVAELLALLDRAARSLDAWPAGRSTQECDVCREALERARAEAERLRASPGPLDFGALNARIGDVLHPLETYAEVEPVLRGRRA